jgi:hypothetical protein
MEDGSRKVSVNVGPIESNLSKKDEIVFLMDGGNDADAAVDVETEVNDGAADTDDDDGDASVDVATMRDLPA